MIWASFSKILEKKCEAMCMAQNIPVPPQLNPRTRKQWDKEMVQQKKMNISQKLYKKNFDSTPSVKHIQGPNDSDSKSLSME